MTGRSRRIAVLAGGILVAAVVIGVVAIMAGPSSHGDGAGPLGSIAQDGHESMSTDASSGATSWTYGVRLCLAEGTAAPIVKSVTPTSTLGAGFKTLGTMVRTFTPSSVQTPIISVDGYPPAADDVPGPTEYVAGFEVTTPCANGPTEPYTELLVGLASVSPDGGGWLGITVAYSVDGKAYVLKLDHDLLICGASNPVC